MAKRRTNTKRTFHNDFDFQPVNATLNYEVPKKKFSIHDLNDISPMTYAQEKVFELWGDDCSMLLCGSAGTGKTMISIFLALREILSGRSPYKKLIIVRSAVEVRSQGFVPGDLEEKQAIYELPYHELFNDILRRRGQYKIAKDSGLVEFVTTSTLRGTTFKDSIIVVDECQNMNYQEITTCITRVGTNSKIVLCGDTKQNDLQYKKNDTSGFPQIIEIVNMMPSFRGVNFTIQDVVRSAFVKEFLIAEDRFEKTVALRQKQKE